MSWSRSSSTRLRLRRAEPNSLPPIMGLLLNCGMENAADSVSQPIPLARFDLNLLAALCRQGIELRAPVVLRRAVIVRNPTTLDQAVQRRVQRTLLHRQHMIRT